VIRSITSQLCAEKNVRDLSAIADYLKRRVAAHPGEPYVKLAEEANASQCQPPPPPPPPRNEVRLISAKERRLKIRQGQDI